MAKTKNSKSSKSTDNNAVSFSLTATHRKLLEDAASYQYLAIRNPWVRSSIERMAMEASSDDYSIHSSNDEDPDIIDLKSALRIFLDNINEDEDFGELQEDIFRDLAKYGNWYGHIQRDKYGYPCAIYTISPMCIAPVPSDDPSDKSIAGFAYYPQGWQARSGSVIPATEIIHIPLNRDGMLGTGLSLIESLEITLLLSEYAIKHQRGFFSNGVNAGDVYSFSVEMGAADVEREREFLMTNSSVEQSFSPLLVQGIELIKAGRSGQNDMEFGHLLDRCREEICSVFGIPLSIMSTEAMGALGATGKEQDYIMFRSQVVAYMQAKVFRHFNRRLLLKEFRLRDVWMMPPASSKIRPDMAESALKILQAGGTMNESRRMLGYNEIVGCDEPIMNFRGAAVIGVPLDEESAVITPTGTIKGIMNVTGVAEAGMAPHVRQLPTDAEENEDPQSSGNPQEIRTNAVTHTGPRRNTYENQYSTGGKQMAYGQVHQGKSYADRKPTLPTGGQPHGLPRKVKVRK